MAQKTTDNHLHNALTMEVLGNSAIPAVSINYHRFFSRDSSQHPMITFAVRIGGGVIKYNSGPVYVFFPAEGSVMLGSDKLKPELGFGYTPIFGNISIQTGATASNITNVNSIDYLIGRVGLAFKSSNRGKLFLRLGWTPKYYLTRNPISTDDNSMLSKRVVLGWAGFSVGCVF